MHTLVHFRLQQNSEARVKRILVVDDNADNRYVIGRLLQLGGYTVMSANGGREAVQIAERERPALILMDLAMPDIDGWHATAQIKDQPELAHIPIIAVTGHVTNDELNRALRVGCTDYLAKPIEYERLMSKVRHHLSAAILDNTREN
jgi:CheY-like chemotaxis protein